MVFAIATAWVFAREFSDRTAKEMLAVPITRTAIIAAKFSIVALWGVILAIMILCIGLAIGAALRLPGWSLAVIGTGVFELSAAAVLTLALMPVVAFAASAGRGYLPALGLAVLMVFLAQIVAATGWGAGFHGQWPRFSAASRETETNISDCTVISWSSWSRPRVWLQPSAGGNTPIRQVDSAQNRVPAKPSFSCFSQLPEIPPRTSWPVLYPESQAHPLVAPAPSPKQKDPRPTNAQSHLPAKRPEGEVPLPAFAFPAM
jgi:hypothetical protein